MGKRGSDILQYSFMILGFAGGWLGYSYINQVSARVSGGFLWILGVILITIAAAVIGLYLSTILHEAGHLIGGFLTGHRFVFFSVFNLTIMKKDGKLIIRKRGITGASGMCLMSPPGMKNGTYPHKLFISGGFLVNFLVSAVCFYLFYYLAGATDLWARAFLVIGIVNAFFCILNAIPQRAVGISDGYVLIYLGNEKNTAMRRGCWSYMRFLELDVKGARARDISTELFDWVDTGNISDMFVFQTACKRYDYLLDRQKLGEARVLLQTLCDNLHSSVADVQKMSCYGELLFHELIGECRQEEIDRLYTKELKDYIKVTRSETSTLRLMYAYAALAIKDSDKAKEHLDLFNKARAVSIWSGTALGEQELIVLIDTVADKRKSG